MMYVLFGHGVAEVKPSPILSAIGDGEREDGEMVDGASASLLAGGGSEGESVDLLPELKRNAILSFLSTEVYQGYSEDMVNTMPREVFGFEMGDSC